MGRRAWVVWIVIAALGEAHADPANAVVTGTVVDQATGEPLLLATITASQPGSSGEAPIALADEHGAYRLELPPGTWTLRVYYAAAAIERPGFVATAGAALTYSVELAVVPVDPPPQRWSSVTPTVEIEAPPLAWWVGPESPLVARHRDTAAIASLDASVEPAHLVTTIDGARRLAGAPALAAVLFTEARVDPPRVPVDVAAGTSGALDLTSAPGANRATASVQVDADTDGRGTAEGFARGFFVRNKAWWSIAGEYAGPHDAQALARVDAMATTDQAVSVTALHADASPPPPRAALDLAGIATSPGTRDDLAIAQWTGRFRDGSLVLRGGAVAERLDGAAGDTTRTAARAAVVDRVSLLGEQTVRAGVEVGGGDAPAGRTRDVTVYAGDDFWVLANLAIDAGVRVDDRRIGATGARAWQPHAQIAWDWTKEGRSSLFATASRQAGLDEAAPAPARDDVLAGAAYQVCLGVIGLAVHEAIAPGDRRTGADVWIDHRAGGHVDLRADASSIDRAVAGHVTFSIDDKDEMHDESLRLAIDGRAASAPGASFVGASLAAEHHGHDGAPSTALAIELVVDERGTLARAVASVAY